MFSKKLKFAVYLLIAVILTLGFSISLQGVLASLLETVGTSVHIGNTGINVGNDQNLFWGELGSSSSSTGSFVLLQKAGADKFRIDHNGNVTVAGNLNLANNPITNASSLGIEEDVGFDQHILNSTSYNLPWGGTAEAMTLIGSDSVVVINSDLLVTGSHLTVAGKNVCLADGTIANATNADTVDWLHVHDTQSTQSEANKIVRTQNNGYTMLGWINTVSGDNGVSTPSRVYTSTDGYIRYQSASNFRVSIGQSDDWTNRGAITGDSNYWTGTNGWGASKTWATAWEYGFGGVDLWGTNMDHPQGAGYIHAQGIISGLHYNAPGTGYGWMMVGAHAATENRYWLRGKWGGSVSGWVEMITTGNIGSQSVNYANSAGNANACTNDGNCDMPGSGIWNSSGNVGIGVAAPGTKLEVIDSATNVARIIRNSANTSGLQRVLAIKGSSTGSSVDGFGPVIEYELLDNSGTTYTLAYSGAVRSGADNNGSMVFWTMNNGTLSEKMRITNTGNVGIKETNPTNSLAVSGVIRAAGNAGDYGGWGTGGWAVELGRDATYGYVGSYDRSASIYKPLYLFASKILLNGGGEGDVGIGTTNPGAKLDVMSSNSRARLARTVNNGGPGDDTFYGGYFEGPSSQMSTQNSYGVYSKVISGASTENNIAVIGEADGNNAVNGSRTALYGWAHGITGTNYGLLIYSYGAPTNYGVYSYADRNYFSGKVGIGVTDAGSYKLYVNGNAYTTGTWGGSDARWKKNILPLEDSLSEIIRLQGVNYEWKTEEYPNQGFTEGPQIGLIAQDVEKVIPELVRTGEDGYKSVSYEKLTAVLVEAIKTQQKQIKDEQTEKDAEIKTLRKEIEISQKENRELQARLDRIEAELLK